jgi:hypothetical protein
MSVRSVLSWAVLAGAVAAACASGSNATFHTGLASAAEGAISIEADGWTYGVPLDGVMWIDENGTRHDGGRPDCLKADLPPRMVRFAAVEVTVEGTTWRPVVWVDCR